MKSQQRAQAREKSIAKASARSLLRGVLSQLIAEQGLQLNDIIETYQEIKQTISIPISIFSHNLKPMQALCKFLRENQSLSNKQVAELLDQNPKNTWANYQRASKKMESHLAISKSEIMISVDTLNNSQLTILEATILHLTKVHNKTTKDIAQLLNKSPNSIAVLRKRAENKLREKNSERTHIRKVARSLGTHTKDKNKK